MAKQSQNPYRHPFVRWIEHRLPIISFFEHTLKQYQVPKNLSFLWTGGFIAGFMLVVMIITGILLAMHYIPHPDHAFDSVERIMREVNFGWLIRYLHANGASLFFLVVYMHMFRSIYYGSYKSPRELLWIIGMISFFNHDGNRLLRIRSSLGPNELLGRNSHNQSFYSYSLDR